VTVIIPSQGSESMILGNRSFGNLIPSKNRCFASITLLGLSLAIFASTGAVNAVFASRFPGDRPIATFDGDYNAKVNGKPVTVDQPAFAGDVIETPGMALGIIHFPGQGLVRITAEARASVEQSGKQIWLGLQRGYLGVHEGAAPVSVRAHGGKISAASGAVFEVAQIKDATYVTAIQGSAVISEGGLAAPQSVAQGQSVKVAFLEPGPRLPAPSRRSSPPDSPVPQAADGSDTTCKDLKSTCSKNPSTCKVYAQRCPVCNDPCKGGSGSQACKDFKALEAKCTPLRKACAKDATKCSDYGTSCSALAGCKGYGGVLEAQAGAASGAAASAAAASAVTAGTSAAASSAAVAATAGGVAAGAAAVAAATTVTASAAAGGSLGTIVSISTSPNGCPAGTVAVRILTGADAGQYDCIVSH
jgi:hypothetical protein